MVSGAEVDAVLSTGPTTMFVVTDWAALVCVGLGSRSAGREMVDPESVVMIGPR